MKTIKSHTDLNQSRVLAEFLPHESADMSYTHESGAFVFYGIVKYSEEPIFGKPVCDPEKAIPCWSLVALLEVIPKKIKCLNILRTDINEEYFSIWYDEAVYGVNTELPDITMKHPVDACVEMIVKLHEQKLI